MNSCNMNNVIYSGTTINNFNNICDDNLMTAYISVLNRDVYLVAFWGSFDYKGQTVGFSVAPFKAAQQKSMNIPLDATNIHIIVQAAIFLSDWKIVYENYFSLSDKYCFLVDKTGLNPYCVPVPCTSLGR